MADYSKEKDAKYHENRLNLVLRKNLIKFVTKISG
jgi:hypothetical protein